MSLRFLKQRISLAILTQNHANGSRFSYLEEVWKYEWDTERGTILPDRITDAAIRFLKTGRAKRTIIHYMQPHFPSVPEPIAEGIDIERFGSEWQSVWDLIQSGNITEEDARDSYRLNLEFVLQSIKKLLSNIDKDKVILSADHANAFAEWGLYGHPINKPAPVIRRVPWISVEAKGNNEYTPIDNCISNINDDVKRKLRDLGYM